MNDDAKKFVNISIWLTVIFLLIRIFISWADIENMRDTDHISDLCYNLFGFIGEAISIAAVFMTAFNKWAWKWKYLSWIHEVPVLAKKYEGIFVSDYDGEERLAILTIDQTYLNVKVQLKTGESSSRSLLASFIEMQGVRYLIYAYHNDPRAEIQDRSPMHYGTSMLDVSNNVILVGNYYTGRKTRGSMTFEAMG